MKKALIAIAVMTCFAFSTQEEKTFNLKLSETQVRYMWGGLDGIKRYADNSNLPNQEVRQIIGVIDSIQRMLAPQINAQSK